MAIRSSNYYSRDNNAYYKTSFVEIVRIFVKNTVFGLYIIYKYKLFANNLWIFIFNLLVVIFIYKMRPKFRLVFNEIISLKFVNKRCVVFI